MDEKLLIDLQTNYGLFPTNITPVSGGYMNKKWRIEHGGEAFLVKRYSHERFSKDKLNGISLALKRQMLLESKGIVCPHILPYRGEPLRFMDENTTYMVMTHCAGEIGDPQTVTAQQLHSLGVETGKLHAVFTTLPIHGVMGYPLPHDTPLNTLRAHQQQAMQKLPPDAPDAYKQALYAQAALINALSDDAFAKAPQGIAHEDYSADNMLFLPQKLSAILDFDRNRFSFLWHDIGRVLLSLALNGDVLNREGVRAFREGYNTFLSLSPADLVAALRLTWCIEVPWWVTPGCFTRNEKKPTRFLTEMLWLAAHWDELDDLLR